MEEKLLRLGLQTFFVSKEISRCPLIPEIQNMSKKLSSSKTYEKNRWVISSRYGKRMIISTNTSHIANLQKEDFIEVVDYDPVKKTALVIGVRESSPETLLHWLIYRARKDVNVIIHIQNNKDLEKLSRLENIPVADGKVPYITLTGALDTLKVLKKGDYIILRNEELLVVGVNLKLVGDKILSLYKRHTHDS
jgi:hypothetical protein